MNLIRDICNQRRPSRKLVAHHEAGHAVLSTIVLRAPDRLVIEPTGGRAILPGPPDGVVDVAFARIALAGFAAEELFLGYASSAVKRRLWIESAHRPPPEGLDAPGSDEAKAARTLQLLGETSVLGCRSRLAREYGSVRERLRRDWSAVHALAHALDRASQLDRRAVEEVLSPFGLIHNGGAADGS